MRGIPIGVLVLAIAAARTAPASAEEKHLWVPPTYQTDTGLGNTLARATWPITASGLVRFSVAIPADIEYLTVAKLVMVPRSPAGSGTLRLALCRAENGNLITTGCPNHVDLPYTAVTEQLQEIDVTTELKPYFSRPGRGYVAVTAWTVPAGRSDAWLGLRLTYQAVTEFATLGSNTFRAPQIAPEFVGAFVGSGAGLTGVAKTGAGNTWTGANDLRGTTSMTAPLHLATCREGYNPVSGGPCVNSSPTMLTLNNSSFLGGPRPFADCVTRFSGVCLQWTLNHTTDTFLGIEAGWRTVTSTTATGTANTGVGARTLYLTSAGTENTAVGQSALVSNASGSRNVAVGSNAGANTTGSGNIYLGAETRGVAGESNTMYLGKVGVQTRAFIAGVYGVMPTGAARTVVIDANGQLGATAIQASADVDALQQIVTQQQRRIDALERQLGTVLEVLATARIRQ